MEEKQFRTIKVNRVVDEPSEKPFRTIKVKRVKEEKKTLEDMRIVKVINFKKEYEEFLKLGVSPDAFVESEANKIAFLYFYCKSMDMDKSLLKARLKEIKYIEFMKIYVDTSPAKLAALGVYKKMQNASMLLLNLLVKLDIEHDKKIKLPMSLLQFQNAIINKHAMEQAPKSDYRMDGVRRIFAIKDGLVIPMNDDGTFEDIDMDSLKSCVIMVEYSTSKFVSIPFKYYRKILNIKEFEMMSYTVIDCDNNASDVIYVSHDDLNDDNDSIVYFNEYRSAKGIIKIIFTVLDYENYMDQIDNYSNLTNTACYSSFEEVILTYKNGDTDKINYNDLINKYFPYVRL